MKKLRKIGKGFLFLVMVPIVYFLLAILFSYIPVEGKKDYADKNHSIYLHTNGVHLDIIFPKELMSEELLQGLNHKIGDRYFSFGWGDRDFYINTPHWEDLTFSTAFSAMFLPSPTLVHVSRYRSKPTDATEIKISEAQVKKMNQYLLNTFLLDKQGNKKILAGKGYAYYDDFFEAKGTYSCFNTCNTWVNDLCKVGDIKACFWTPFDFALLKIHELEK